MKNIPKKSIILSIAAVLVVVAGWFFYYTNYTLHITKMSPKVSEIATLTPSIAVTFNKDIASIGKIYTNPDTGAVESYTFSGKDIVILTGNLDSNQEVVLVFEDVKSNDNYTFNKTLRFKPVVKSLEDLPEDVVKEILKRQDRFTDVDSDPIQAVVPHSTANYDLTLEVTGQNEKNGNIYAINALITLSAADVRINREEAILQYQTEIREYLIANNITPEEYLIKYEFEEPSLY